MKRKLDRPRAALLLATALTVAFIFGNSLLPRDASLAESGKAADLVEIVVRPVVAALAGEARADTVMAAMDVRKIAHFVEFFVLGALAFALARPVRARRAVCAGYFCFTVAFLDESIQILTGRGPMIADVWLDLSGALCGMGLMFVIFAARRARTRRKAGADGRDG